MAILRRNYEQVYLLDYLQSPIITDISVVKLPMFFLFFPFCNSIIRVETRINI